MLTSAPCASGHLTLKSSTFHIPFGPPLAPRLPCRPSQNRLWLLQGYPGRHGPLSSPLLERAWGPLQPFATVLWHFSGVGSHGALCATCHACLPFILSSVPPQNVREGGNTKFALNKALPSCRKQRTARELSLTQTCTLSPTLEKGPVRSKIFMQHLF